MSFFLPSFFQKRILRYALSRLELLDTNGLDLEKLDITWGKKSTVELRDIGINIEKISALLKLPQSILITKAQISTLRVTIPADIYQSSIVLEADGVAFAVEADSANEDEAVKVKNGLSEQGSSAPSRITKVDRPKSSPPLAQDLERDSIDKEFGPDEDVHLPTTLDLAQSFVLSEPTEERSELQAAVAHSIQTSLSSPSIENDLDASEVGMGNNISLPTFLAAYLKGVGNRVKVNVKNIKVDLVLGLVNKAEPHAIEDVKIRIAISKVAVGEVSGDLAGERIRRFEAQNIQLAVISEQSLFSSLAKSANFSSPETTQESVILANHSRSHKYSSVLAEASSSAVTEGDLEHRIANHRGSQLSISSVQTNTMAKIGAVSSMDHAPAAESLPKSSIMTDSFHSVEDHNCFLDRMSIQPEYPQYSMDGEENDETLSRWISPIPRTAYESARCEGSPPASFDAFPAPKSSQTHADTAPTHASLLTQNLENPKILREDLSVYSQTEQNLTTAQSSPSSEDLAESRIFSHDQRESMYMSVLSDIPPSYDDNKPHIPGAWESSYADDNPSATVQNEKLEPQIAARSHDKAREPTISEFDNSPVTEGRQFDRLNPATKSLKSEEPAQQSFAPTADPKLRIDLAASENTNRSTQCSLSPTGSPRASLVLTKRVLLVDSMIVELPCGNTETTSHFLDKGELRTPPEILSTTRPDHEGKPSSGPAEKYEGRNLTSESSQVDLPQKATVIAVGNIQIVGDVGLTKLCSLLAEKLSSICQPLFPSKAEPAPSRPQRPYDYFLTVDGISWKFVDLVKAVSALDSAAASLNPSSALLHEGSEILLSSYITQLHLNRVQSKEGCRTNMTIGKFAIGYADADILSFNADPEMRKSFRDTSVHLDKALTLNVVETKNNTSIDIKTLPMHVALDLRRLDETFSWFGGFSSMLGLGSSMVSTVTFLDPNTVASPLKKVPRGVHFDVSASGRVQGQGVTSRTKKVTARIGGFLFDLHGTKCGLRVESTAMKLVSRSEGLAVQIDRLTLHGPAINNRDDHLPILVKVANIRIEYLTTPKENDLTRLLTLLAPSKDTYGDEDDILIDTLLRQRKKGGVLRITIENADLHFLDIPALQCFPILVEEANKLSTVAKYLPEDDRPGILTLLLIKSLKAETHISEKFGVISVEAKNAEVANITFPSLTAVGIGDLQVCRNTNEELVGKAITAKTDRTHLEYHPMIMVRFIGNEMEPTIKMKVHNSRFEYHVATVMALMDLKAEVSAEELVSDMISSVVTLTSRRTQEATPSKLPSDFLIDKNNNTLNVSKALKFDVAFREVILGLNPRGIAAKGLVVLTDTHFTGMMPNEIDVQSTLEIKKAELMTIDDISSTLDLNVSNARKNVNTFYTQVQGLSETGYVSVGQISAAKVNLQVIQSRADSESIIDIEIRDNLIVLESCADSTQTVISLLKFLKPPAPKSTALKYQTEIVPVEDMLASFSGEAFAMDNASQMTQAHGTRQDDDGDSVEDDNPQNLEFISSFYDPDPNNPISESMGNSTMEEDIDSVAASSVFTEDGDEQPSESFQEHVKVMPNPSSLDIRDDYFDLDSSIGGAAYRWNLKQNNYGPSKDKLGRSPLRVRIRDVHVIWNLFDGYDWQHTRNAISQAVADVQTQALERQAARKRKSFEPEEEEEDVIGDFLFNSIYIGIPAKSDPTELARQINRNIDDLVSETGSFTTSKSGGVSPSRPQPIRPKSKRLRLQRSRHHKMTFELKGISADLVVFPPRSGEIESSLDVRVQDLEIFDHVPTSTWKKFATYMHDAGEKESDTCMIHIEILNVKPVPNLAASEIILKASVLPLRLHVDQDALDFMTRFFDFKEDNAPDMASAQVDAPFIQRAEFKSIRIKLDFKPKRVNYAGLRSGRTTEFMNFFVLDSADMVLRHAIVYGVLGFDRLGKTLNDIWMPDIKRNQLPGVLAGLAPVRSLVNVGGGIRDLVIVPIREYRKDGRVVRSFQKGALAFAKTTTSELMRLGAKLAIGTQTVLQSAEDILNQSKHTRSRQDIAAGWDDSDVEENEKKKISLYADQPVGVVQGLRGAYASLERDLLTARDAVVAMPGEIMESGTAGGAAKAVIRRAPTVILRPAMGVSMAVGQTLMGATNSLDPGNRRRVEDKYKKH